MKKLNLIRRLKISCSNYQVYSRALHEWRSYHWSATSWRNSSYHWHSHSGGYGKRDRRCHICYKSRQIPRSRWDECMILQTSLEHIKQCMVSHVKYFSAQISGSLLSGSPLAQSVKFEDRPHPYMSHTQEWFSTYYEELKANKLSDVAYKIISKILTERLKSWLNGAILENQSTLIPGRLITDNVLIAHELMHSLNT